MYWKPKRCVTCFIVILTSSWWSGTKPTVSLRDACNSSSSLSSFMLLMSFTFIPSLMFFFMKSKFLIYVISFSLKKIFDLSWRIGLLKMNSILFVCFCVFFSFFGLRMYIFFSFDNFTGYRILGLFVFFPTL